MKLAEVQHSMEFLSRTTLLHLLGSIIRYIFGFFFSLHLFYLFLLTSYSVIWGNLIIGYIYGILYSLSSVCLCFSNVLNIFFSLGMGVEFYFVLLICIIHCLFSSSVVIHLLTQS